MGLFRDLLRNRSGASAVEFALIFPVLMMGLFACLQLGMLFFASAGLQNMVGEGARAATIWPRLSEAQIQQRMSESAFGMKPQNMPAPVFDYGVSNGQDYVEITQSYNAQMNFLLFTMDDIVLTETRRAYRP